MKGGMDFGMEGGMDGEKYLGGNDIASLHSHVVE